MQDKLLSVPEADLLFHLDTLRSNVVEIKLDLQKCTNEMARVFLKTGLSEISKQCSIIENILKGEKTC